MGGLRWLVRVLALDALFAFVWRGVNALINQFSNNEPNPTGPAVRLPSSLY